MVRDMKGSDWSAGGPIAGGMRPLIGQQVDLLRGKQVALIGQ